MVQLELHFFFSCFFHFSCLNKFTKSPKPNKIDISSDGKDKDPALWSSGTLGTGFFLFYLAVQRGNNLGTPAFFAQKVVFSHTDFLTSRIVIHFSSKIWSPNKKHRHKEGASKTNAELE